MVASEQLSTSMSEYSAVLRRRGWIIVLVALITIWGGTAYTFKQQVVYRSSATLVVELPLAGLNSSSLQQQTQSLSAQLQTPQYAEKAIEELKLGMSTSTLLSHLNVITKPDSLALQVEYDDTDSNRGVLIVDSVTKAFVDDIKAQLLKDQAAASPAPVPSPSGSKGTKPSVKPSPTPPPPKPSQLTDVMVFDPAQVVGKVQPKPLRNVAIAAMLGLLLGVVAAFVREQFDDTLRGPGEAEEAFGQEATATLPPRFLGYGPLRVARNRKVDPVLAELTIQRLAANLVWSREARGSRTMLVTSAQPEEGKSTVTSNLAVELAASGHRVIVVEADLRRPMLHQYLGRDASAGTIGLEAVIRHRATLTAALVDIPLWSTSGPSPNGRSGAGEVRGRLRAILASPGHAWPAEVGPERLVEVMNALKSRADYVIFDAPPILVVPDAYPLIGAVDMVIAVVRSGKSGAGATAAMARLLERLEPKQLELVVTETEETYERTSYHTYITPRTGTRQRRGSAQVEPEPSS